MYMTIQQILREKNLSRYQLSKKSGVPWATLADICSGKTTLSRCSAGTLMKLSSTLDNGNWGFLVDEEKQQAELAPVYDCGSCLYPQLDLERMKTVLQDEAEIDQRIYTFPTSSIEEGGKKISYFDYISSLKNPDCNEALKRVCSRIDLDAIHNFLEDVPELLPIQREFYLTMLTERKEKILDYSLELLMEQEQHTSPVLEM